MVQQNQNKFTNHVNVIIKNNYLGVSNMENEETKTEKKLDEDLNKILSENDLQSYTDILVK